MSRDEKSWARWARQISDPTDGSTDQEARLRDPRAGCAGRSSLRSSRSIPASLSSWMRTEKGATGGEVESVTTNQSLHFLTGFLHTGDMLDSDVQATSWSVPPLRTKKGGLGVCGSSGPCTKAQLLRGTSAFNANGRRSGQGFKPSGLPEQQIIKSIHQHHPVRVVYRPP